VPSASRGAIHMQLLQYVLASCLASAAVPVAAQTDADRELETHEAQQRERIAQTRMHYGVQFRDREAACYQRFAVNDCLNESRRAERELLADLRRQELLISDAQRKRRGAAQLLRTDERLHGIGRP